MLSAELTKAVAYARFSTDRQNERSTEDQLDLCRDFAKREGLEIVATYADKAVSGASMHGRHELKRMLRDAYAGEFNVIVVEALDRLSRDMEDMAGIYKRLLFHNIEIIEVHGGKASTAMVGMKAMFAQLFREENVHKVRRGMTGLIKQGLSAGGKAYGYRPDPANPGKPIIVEDEAAIVLRIFEDYSKGVSPRAICKRLNAEHVKPPRGKLWSPSALVGYAVRGTGMLRNPIFVGRIVWNKNRMIKDPSTGKRVSRPNPESDWKSAAVPELRILPDELFKAVQALMAGRSHGGRADNIGIHKRPKRLLSGLLKCGACGSGMAVAGVDKSGRTRIRCSAHVNSGACPDPKTFYLADVEELVIQSLTKELASPEQIEIYARRYIEARHAQGAHEHRRRAEIEARIAAIAKDNDRLLDLLMAGKGDQDAIDARMKAQGAERDDLKQELASLPKGNNVVLHPTAINAFAGKLMGRATDPLRSPCARLEMALNLMDDMGELAPIVRELIRSITLDRDDDGCMTIEVEATLAPFLQEDAAPVGAAPLVAEERYRQYSVALNFIC
ncbi:recombinase family protein [Aliihoeflea sp. 40Bstr573]|uniref:recombinase family protein n=1 Tax=Aliihoeflea sp. 40Bstr573 TaxID=2696467 RepID=UPI002094D16A|nr:recombinase family protein [Aliihoeflea sp. 40Bstr573]MCO6387798.1 recombinase family protein [Aliihoeflea sp. 40Bstr573]